MALQIIPQLVITGIDNINFANMLIRQLKFKCEPNVTFVYNNSELTITNVDSNTMVDDIGDVLLTDYIKKLYNRCETWVSSGRKQELLDELGDHLDKGGRIHKFDEKGESTTFFIRNGELFYVDCITKDTLESISVETGEYVSFLL